MTQPALIEAAAYDATISTDLEPWLAGKRAEKADLEAEIRYLKRDLYRVQAALVEARQRLADIDAALSAAQGD